MSGRQAGCRTFGSSGDCSTLRQISKDDTWAKWSILWLSPAHCWALRGPTLVSFANWKLTSGGWSISAQCRTPLMGNLFWSPPSPPHYVIQDYVQNAHSLRLSLPSPARSPLSLHKGQISITTQSCFLLASSSTSVPPTPRLLYSWNDRVSGQGIGE